MPQPNQNKKYRKKQVKSPCYSLVQSSQDLSIGTQWTANPIVKLFIIHHSLEKGSDTELNLKI